MFNLLTLNSDAFGLNISDLSIKIAKLKKQGKFFRLVCFGETSLNPGVIENGEIKNPQALIEAIKISIKNIKGETLKTNQVIASLPEEKAFAQMVLMPLMIEEELAQAIRFEAENYVPLPINDVYLDFQVIKPLYNHLNYLDVLLTAISKKIVDEYLEVLEKSGLKVLVLETESQAIARALIKDHVSPIPVLIIDLGASRTSFMIFAGFSLRFSSFIPISQETLTSSVARSLNIDPKEAENLKMKYGLGKNKKDVFGALIPVITDLLEQIKKHLSFYETHSNNHHLPSSDSRVQKVLLCGGGANLKGLAEFLSKYLALPVELANPWINILPPCLKQIPLIPFEDSLRYATALGLALRGQIHD